MVNTARTMQTQQDVAVITLAIDHHPRAQSPAPFSRSVALCAAARKLNVSLSGAPIPSRRLAKKSAPDDDAGGGDGNPTRLPKLALPCVSKAPCAP